MSKNDIEFNWKLIGAKLANLDEKDQSQFFEGFANDLDNFDSHTAKEMQMLHVNDKLSKRTKDILEKYFPSLYYKPEDK